MARFILNRFCGIHCKNNFDAFVNERWHTNMINYIVYDAYFFIWPSGRMLRLPASNARLPSRSDWMSLSDCALDWFTRPVAVPPCANVELGINTSPKPS